MRYGIEVVNLGDLADPRIVVRLARAAEDAGWEGLFVWDHLAFVWGVPSSDPYVVLAAVAQATERLRLGAEITPLARRRPHHLAHQVATLDLLSNGRVTFCAGLGGERPEFEAFGEDADPKVRAVKLDEGLAIVDGLWSGDEVTFHGVHHTVERVRLEPVPVQRPRIPIWIGGDSRPALRRAARWDGWIVTGVGTHAAIRSPDELAASVAYVREHRRADTPFDIAITGWSDGPNDTRSADAFSRAGATWWLESVRDERGTLDELLARVLAGPPRRPRG